MSQAKLVRRPEVLKRVPFSNATLHRKVTEGTFPAPVKIGARAVAWLAEEIDVWERKNIAERDARLAASEERAA
jgi:prophage regulatory protein